MERICFLRNWIALLVCGLCAFFCSGCSKPASEKAAEHEAVSSAIPGNQDTRPVIVALGNSLTAGLGVDPTLNYPSGLQKIINEEGYFYRVVNAGVSGDTTDQGLNRIQTIIDLHPAIVIVELGANDGLRGLPVEVTRQNLASIVRRLQSAGAKVVLAGMQVPPNYGPLYTSAFRSVFRDVARQYRIPLMPFFLDGVAGNPALNQDDGIHPTAEGYEVIVRNIWRVLEPLLQVQN